MTTAKLLSPAMPTDTERMEWPIADKPFHRITPDDWKALCEAGATWGETREHHPQPKWCGYPDAVDPLGCWSLIDPSVRVNEKSCRSRCDLYCGPRKRASIRAAIDAAMGEEKRDDR